VRIFGIDPGSERTGYGCLETDGTRHLLVTAGENKLDYVNVEFRNHQLHTPE